VRIPLTQTPLSKSALETKKAFLQSTKLKEQMQAYVSGNHEGNLPIKDYTDTQYVAEMDLGTPDQQFMVVPDTGSSNVWVYSSSCWTSPACYVHKTYKEKKSDSFEKDGHKFELNYGSGGIKGFWSKDTVGFGGLDAEHFTFGEVNSASGMAFIVGHMDGILGLAYPSISVDNLPVFMESADTEDQSFSFLLGHTDQESYLVVPGVDEDLFTGNMQYHPVIEQKYWSLNMTEIKVGDVSIPKVNEYKGVIDSGTSLIVGSTEIVNPIIEQIGEIDQTCKDNSGHPDVTISFDGVEYTLTSEDYIVKVESFLGTACLLGIMASEFPEGFNYLIIGDTFMRKYYTHFDQNENRVGFATPNFE
jgi:hypothetical protein